MTDFSRRTVVRGAAWTTPVVLVVGAAPAFATSLRKDPGINGWVQVGTQQTSTNGTYDVEFDSTPNGAGPDGAPYGLYIYDVNLAPNDKFQNARITLWLNDTQSAASVSTLSGHSGSWNYLGSIGTATKPDGFSYTGYQFSYNGAIDAASYVTDSFDGQKRLYLGDFHVSIRANQVANNGSANMTYWVERSIDVQAQGAGPFVTRSFQRRNGQRGALGNGFPGGGSFRRAVGAGLPV